ncbi:MAG: Cd(II)/Pb(II)-responsive transcriptional regulator [Burkholderiales bacterium]|nr:Cd(II)/Pb(II)-responsive transcriptional regulator [Burkholderiales bacterium]
MKIGELARKSGASAKTIRFYEEQGLLGEAARTESNYREYASADLDRLQFVLQCRSLDLGLQEIKRLLSLRSTPDANCGEVDELLDEHIRKVQQQRKSLAKLEKALKSLRADCHPSQTVKGCGILR